MGVSVDTAQLSARSSVPSTIRRRFFALLIDGFILSELGSLIASTFGILHVTSGNPGFGEPGFHSFTTSASLGQPWELLGTVAYFLLLELLFGGTLGKLGVGLRVASDDGTRASAIAVVKRNILRPIDFFFLIGALPVLFGGREQRFGDMWAHTKVLRFSGDGDPAPLTWPSAVKAAVLIAVFV